MNWTPVGELPERVRRVAGPEFNNMTADEQWAWLGQQMDRLLRVMDVVNAPGTVIEPSKINRNRVVVVNGITDLDACEATAGECFDALFAEEDGGPSPGRIAFVFTRAPAPVPTPDGAA